MAQNQAANGTTMHLVGRPPPGHNEQGQHDEDELDRTNLYIKGLAKACTQVELDDIFKQFGVINQSRVYGDGVGFVRFDDANAAEAAIRALHGKMPGPHATEPLMVKYAFRKSKSPKRFNDNRRDGDRRHRYGGGGGSGGSSRPGEIRTMKNTNNVYLRCLPKGFTETDLLNLCEPYGALTCTRLRDSGVAFVRYKNASDAARAIRELNGRSFGPGQDQLLAKLANSDPFQPKISFNNRDDGHNNHSNGHHRNYRGGGGRYRPDNFENEYRGHNRFDYNSFNGRGGGQQQQQGPPPRYGVDPYDDHPYGMNVPPQGQQQPPFVGGAMMGQAQQQPPPENLMEPPPGFVEAGFVHVNTKFFPHLQQNQPAQAQQQQEANGDAVEQVQQQQPQQRDDKGTEPRQLPPQQTHQAQNLTSGSQQQQSSVASTNPMSNVSVGLNSGAIPFTPSVFVDASGQRYVHQPAFAPMIPVVNAEFGYQTAPSSVSGSGQYHYVHQPDVAQMSATPHVIPGALVVQPHVQTSSMMASPLSPSSPGGSAQNAMFNQMMMNRPASLHSITSIPSIPHSGFSGSNGIQFIPSAAAGNFSAGLVAPISANAQTVGTIAQPVLYQQVMQPPMRLQQPGEQGNLNLAQSGVANLSLASPNNAGSR